MVSYIFVICQRSCHVSMTHVLPPLSVILKTCLSSSYINSWQSWRWVYGIWGLIGVGLVIPYVILVPETRGGVILAARAQRARKAGHKNAWAIHEKLGHRSAKQILQQTVFRPAGAMSSF